MQAIENSAVNDGGFTSSNLRRWLPNPEVDTTVSSASLTSQYTIDLLPANAANCYSTTQDASTTMIDQENGTFKIRVTGRAGPPIPASTTLTLNVPTTVVGPTGTTTTTTSQTVPNNAKNRELCRNQKWVERTVVLEFRRRGFADFAYFTDFESQDPLLHFYDPTRAATFCSNYWQYRTWRSSEGYTCTEIQFISGDYINGPFHTNDAAKASTGAVFGRNSRDRVEIGYGPCPFRTNNQPNEQTANRSSTPPVYCNAVNPTVRGTLATGSAVEQLSLPDTNQELAIQGDEDAGGLTFFGQTTITFLDSLDASGRGNMTVQNDNYLNGVVTTIPMPANGVIYVRSLPGCVPYSPRTTGSSFSEFCGDALVNQTRLHLKLL